jgi:hypothetical protein
MGLSAPSGERPWSPTSRGQGGFDWALLGTGPSQRPPDGPKLTPPTNEKTVAVQFSWFWGSEEGGERAAGLVGGVKVAEVGEEAAVL